MSKWCRWYRVVKRCGRDQPRYIYDQSTRRVDGRTQTRNRYIGIFGGGDVRAAKTSVGRPQSSGNTPLLNMSVRLDLAEKLRTMAHNNDDRIRAKQTVSRMLARYVDGLAVDIDVVMNGLTARGETFAQIDKLFRDLETDSWGDFGISFCVSQIVNEAKGLGEKAQRRQDLARWLEQRRDGRDVVFRGKRYQVRCSPEGQWYLAPTGSRDDRNGFAPDSVFVGLKGELSDDLAQEVFASVRGANDGGSSEIVMTQPARGAGDTVGYDNVVVSAHGGERLKLSDALIEIRDAAIGECDYSVNELTDILAELGTLTLSQLDFKLRDIVVDTQTPFVRKEISAIRASLLMQTDNITDGPKTLRTTLTALRDASVVDDRFAAEEISALLEKLDDLAPQAVVSRLSEIQSGSESRFVKEELMDVMSAARKQMNTSVSAEARKSHSTAGSDPRQSAAEILHAKLVQSLTGRQPTVPGGLHDTAIKALEKNYQLGSESGRRSGESQDGGAVEKAIEEVLNQATQQQVREFSNDGTAAACGICHQTPATVGGLCQSCAADIPF